MIVQDVHVYEGGVRNRQLIEWDIDEGFDGDSKWWRLIGIVQNEVNGRPLSPGATLRMTTSSPIKNFSGRTVYTESGSVYELIGNPNKRFKRRLSLIDEVYSPENPLSFLRV